MLVGAFAYGRHISSMRMSLTLRQAHMVASGYFPGRGPITFGQEADGDQDSIVPVSTPTGSNTRVSQNTDPSASSDSADDNIDDLLSSDSPMATFQQVYLLLKDQYVEKIPSDIPLAHGAASAMLDSLDDANSRFLEPGERSALEDQAKGIYAGTGIVFTVRRILQNGLTDRQITVIDSLPGSPAQKAGIRTGDVITTVNGHWVIGYDPFAAQAKMLKKLSNDEFDWDKAVDAIDARISEGISLAKAQSLLDTTQTAPVALTIDRPGTAKPIQVSLDCSTPTTVKDVEWRKLDNGQGYIKVNVFDDSTATDLAQAIGSLGTTSGIVLDLRDCPGGMLDPAVSIAHSLSPDAPFGLVIVRDNRAPKTAALGSNSTQSPQDDASSSDPEADVPKMRDFGTRTEVLRDNAAQTAPAVDYSGALAVLVNKGTANTAEMLAAFLRDHRGARIVGVDTFGDAMAQTLFPLTDGSGFTLTTGMLKTGIGKSFNISGLTPDISLKDAGTAGEPGDPGLQRASALLLQVPVASAQIRSQS